ncbi:MAG: Tat pathway signal protein, partial [Tardiphaga sp.]
MADYAAYSAELRAEPVSADVADVIRLATLAANSHNTQPWLFRIGSDAIEILSDFARRTPVVDPEDHHLFVSLGCAATNLSIAAAASGRVGEIDIAPDGAGVRYQFAQAAPRPEPLLGAITKRQSTRREYDGRTIGAGDLATLQAVAELPGVHLVLITARPQMMRIRDLVIAGNAAQMNDPAF